MTVSFCCPKLGDVKLPC